MKLKLKDIHNKLVKNNFTLADAKSEGGWAIKKFQGNHTNSINEITAWLDDEIIEVTIKTANLPHPIKCKYRKIS